MTVCTDSPPPNQPTEPFTTHVVWSSTVTVVHIFERTTMVTRSFEITTTYLYSMMIGLSSQYSHRRIGLDSLLSHEPFSFILYLSIYLSPSVRPRTLLLSLSSVSTQLPICILSRHVLVVFLDIIINIMYTFCVLLDASPIPLYGWLEGWKQSEGYMTRSVWCGKRKEEREKKMRRATG